MLEEVALSTSDLMTIAGASAAAIVLTQFVKRLFNLGATSTRSFSMLVGMGVLTTTVWSTTGFGGIPDIILVLVVGSQAGLAASQAFDSYREGLAHETFPTGTMASPVIGLAITGEGEGIFPEPASSTDPSVFDSGTAAGTPAADSPSVEIEIDNG